MYRYFYQNACMCSYSRLHLSLSLSLSLSLPPSLSLSLSYTVPAAVGCVWPCRCCRHTSTPISQAAATNLILQMYQIYYTSTMGHESRDKQASSLAAFVCQCTSLLCSLVRVFCVCCSLLCRFPVSKQSPVA